MKDRMTLAMVIPLLAALTIVIFAGGLGIIFMLLDSTGAEEWGVVGLGTALVVGVPTVAALLDRSNNQV